VNNYYKPGPATPKNSPVGYRICAIGIRTTQYVTRRDGSFNGWKPMEHVWGRFYVDGNVMEGHEEVTRDNWTKGVYAQINPDQCDGTYTEQTKREIRLAEPLETDVVTTHTAEEAYRLVLDGAGCSKQRDKIDRRIVEETRTGTATYRGSVSADAAELPGLIDVPADVTPEGDASPWCALSDGGVKKSRLRDTDGDGMPDWWEREKGLDPRNAKDGRAVASTSDYYTNLECYLNSLVP
jgi:hypothetical protein